MKISRYPCLFVFVTVLAAWAGESSGIIVRHDRDDRDYVELGARFPAAVHILPDGSGTLIAPRFVLTAAHVARGVSRGRPAIDIDGEQYGVDSVFIHPDWVDHGPHDLALLRLTSPVSTVEPVAIYRDSDEVGLVATFVGRGDTGTGLTGPTDMDGRKRGATNRVEEADAAWVYFTFDEGDGATDLEGVSGPGDSGGPAFVEKEGRLLVIGVSVFNRGGKPGRYGTEEGYTRVSTHAAWIDAIVSETSKE